MKTKPLAGRTGKTAEFLLDDSGALDADALNALSALAGKALGAPASASIVAPGPQNLPPTAGSIAFTAIQSDNSGGGANGDFFQFVLLEAVTTGTTIYFTDSGFRTDTSTFRTNETMVRWVAQGNLSAGTLISLTGPAGASIPSTAEWTGINMTTGATLATAGLTLAAGGESITALIDPVFGGAEALTGTAIAAIVQTPIFAATWLSTSGNGGSALPPGLTDGVNAVSITTNDNSRYNGPISGTAAEMLAAINNDANWTGANTPLSPHGVTTITVTGAETQTVVFNPLTVTLAEGDAGATLYSFTVTRTGGTTGILDFSGTIAGVSTDGADFTGGIAPTVFSGSIAAGQPSATVTVSVNGDVTIEGDEAFQLTLTMVNNQSAIPASIGAGAVATGNITNDDNAGSLSIGDVTLAEGNSGTTAFSFIVTRSGGSIGAVSATWTLVPGAADSADFAIAQAPSGTVSFADGETSKTIIIDVAGDTTFEPDEAFSVVLSAPMGGVAIGDDTGAGLILNDDAAPVPIVSIADASIIEGESGTSILQLTVTRSGPTSAFSVDFATSNGGNPNNASATAGSDYVAQSGTLVFADGQNSATIDILINGDDIDELSEEFTVTLSNATGGATLGDATAIGTITSDDTGPAGPTGVWINEFHYDNAGADAGEFIEIAAQAGTNLAGYSLVLYNGNGGESYQTIDLGGTIPNQAGGYGTLQFAAVGLQNGAPDGIALVGPGGVIEFISYEGTMTAGNGAAVGMTSTDVGVSEPGSASGTSIGRVGGPGSGWVLFSDDTPGQLNAGQLLGPTPTIAVSDVSVNEAAGTMTFTVTRTNVAPVAFTVDYATANGTATAGSDYGAASGTLSFTANQLQALVTVTISDNAVAEFDETLFFNLSNATNGAVISDNQAVGTIVNDDGTPITVSIGDVIQAEGTSGTTIFTFNVVRSGGTGAFDIDFETANGSATVAGNDYLANSGVLNFGVGETFKTISVTVNGDMTPEPVENFFVNLSDATNDVIVTDASGTGTILDGAGTLNFIHDIQGTAYFSPILAGEGITNFNQASAAFVTVQAIVTAVDNDGNRQGFYIQEQITDWDGNNFTSEGIFVMTRNDAGAGTAVSGVAVGDLVTVSAQVMEYQGFSTNMPITALVNPSALVVQSTGNSLPTFLLDAGHPIPNSIMTLVTPDYTDSADGVGDTFDASLYGLSYWETVEGMLVTIPNMVVADGFVSSSGGRPYLQAYSADHADSDQINSRGGYTIAGDPPIGPPDTADTEDDTIQGGRHLHDGDVNPDIIELDWTGWADAPPTGLAQNATMGDLLGDVTGIVGFDFTDRKLFVTDMEPGGFVNGGIPVQETTGLGDDSRALTVATFNVENLDPGDGAARFTALANAMANNLNAPDIICIEEMQDNNGASSSGGADASTTWQMLVNALNLATGGNYQWVDQEPVPGAEGGEPGGNIRVGFLYNTDRVQLGGLDANATLAERRMYTDRIGDGVRDAGDLIAYSDNMLGAEIVTADWTTTRKSLLGEFIFNGNIVYVTANHWPAKGGSGDFWQFNQNIGTGDPDNSDWAQRNEVGQDVYSMMNLIQSGNPNAGIVAGGDFNDFYFYRPLTTVTGHTMADGTARVGGARFDNLTLTLSEAERYTYTFDGRSQAIDHVIANTLLSGVATYDVVHLNTGYNRNGTGPDADPGLSDHDPALSSFNFRNFSEVLTGTGGADAIDGFGGNDTITTQGGNDYIDGGSGTDVMAGGSGDDVYVVDNAGDVVIEASGQGSDVVYARASYALGGGSHVETLAAIDNSAATAMALVGNEFANNIQGNAGANFIDGNAGADVMAGFGGDDVYVVDDAGDLVIEGLSRGNDIVYARTSYALSAGSEVETLAAIDNGLTIALTLIGNEFANTIFGNNGANYIDGAAGADAMVGFGGDDVYIVDNAGDAVFENGGGGADTVYASASYVLTPGSEVETLAATDNSATTAIDLTGNGLANNIQGNNGANLIDGGGGNDVMTGFGGADTFAFTSALGGGNVDFIADFSAVDDIIALDDAVFGGLAPGALNANAFASGPAAADADDRIVYNSATGQLFFDADGNGTGAAIHFATVLPGTILTASDFVVI